MLRIIPGIIISYLVGSIPTAYIFGRLLKGIDIRKYGSGNIGATNALRVLGKGAGTTVLSLDIAKGFIVVFFLSNLFAPRIASIPNETTSIILGLSCILGHVWTIFLRFKGGKGIATTLGVLLGLAVKIDGLKIIIAILTLAWLVIFILTRIVSLASVISAIILPVLMLVFKQSQALVLVSFFLSALTILRHKSNLKRILEGKEPRISFKKSS